MIEQRPSSEPTHCRGAKGDRRFVILTHDHPFLHWDLMLEDADSLITFRLLEEPSADSVIAAEVLPPHRKAYLDYEGPVSGDRGTVTRWDQGTCELLRHGDEEQVWQLRGARLDVAITLKCEAGRWSCRFEPASPE